MGSFPETYNNMNVASNVAWLFLHHFLNQSDKKTEEAHDMYIQEIECNIADEVQTFKLNNFELLTF